MRDMKNRDRRMNGLNDKRKISIEEESYNKDWRNENEKKKRI